MRSVFLVVLLVAFISVFSLKAADFHCAGVFTPQVSQQHEAHTMAGSTDHHSTHGAHAKRANKPLVGHAGAQNSSHEDCPPHLHSCCSSVFVFQKVGQMSLPQSVKAVFSEHIYLPSPAPLIEGPFQPPRLS